MKGRVEGGPGEQARGRDCLPLLPPLGPCRAPTLAWGFSTGKPGLQPPRGLPARMHTYLCLVSWPWGWHRECPRPMGFEQGAVRASPRPISRLRRGKEERLTTTLLTFYKLLHLQRLGPRLARLPLEPLALLVAGHQRPRCWVQNDVDCCQAGYVLWQVNARRWSAKLSPVH